MLVVSCIYTTHSNNINTVHQPFANSSEWFVETPPIRINVSSKQVGLVLKLLLPLLSLLLLFVIVVVVVVVVAVLVIVVVITGRWMLIQDKDYISISLVTMSLTALQHRL